MHSTLLFWSSIPNDNNDVRLIPRAYAGNHSRVIRLFKWAHWINICACPYFVYNFMSFYLFTFEKYAQERNHFNWINPCNFVSVYDWWHWFPFLISKSTAIYIFGIVHFGVISGDGINTCYARDDWVLWGHWWILK